MRLEELRRRLDRDARRFVIQLVAALAIAFALGYLLGRFGR